MAGYIGLLKFTQQGIANRKELPDRVKRSKALAEQMGIRPVGVWMTMGSYDMLIIGDAPDDQTVAAFALALAGAGNVTTETVRAFSEEEISQIVSRLPSG